MARAFLFVLDSVGVGGAPDSAQFGDEGANTLGHIARYCADGRCDRAGLRSGPLNLPNMGGLGLFEALAAASGLRPQPYDGSVFGFHGAATQISSGKDTPSGHWEIAGLPVRFEWGYFPRTDPALPASLTEPMLAEAGLDGYLGGVHASGTEIIEKLGEAHMRTGNPILYTSADSVLQIAAHETRFGLQRLYDLCRIARRHANALNIGRVIARPFIGESATTFRRTGNRRDYAIPPYEDTLLDRVKARGSSVIAVGKISDIFAGRGITETRKADDNMSMFDATLGAMRDAGDGDLVFANFVDFDTLFGHRRDVAGYAASLEAFDRRLPEAISALKGGDLMILTADHGCDPSFDGTDHTRERVPIIGTGPGFATVSVGVRSSLADIGETVAEHLLLAPGTHGKSFLPLIANHA